MLLIVVILATFTIPDNSERIGQGKTRRANFGTSKKNLKSKDLIEYLYRIIKFLPRKVGFL